MKSKQDKNKKLHIILLELVIMALMGNGVAIADNTHPPKHESAPESSGMGHHSEHEPHHQNLEIPEGQPIPEIKLIVHPDSMKGWNLEIQVTNFSFAPERANSTSSTKEGHAHLYIDGKKITRLYGQWYHLPSLEPGKHEITVTLNSNRHETLVYKGKPISATAIIQVAPNQ